jgi:SAM-dependent methyltransferase
MEYENKDRAYFSHIRMDLIRFMDMKKKGLDVLEIGAAYGETLYHLKEKGIAKRAVGVDIFEDTNGAERYKPIDKFLFGNIENEDYPDFENSFDLILLPDVLEHLEEPLEVLKKVDSYLRKGGTVVVSMPNIRHYSAFYRIFVKGGFDYDESGIFDYTHKRFYCRRNIEDLLKKAGFRILKSEGSIRNFRGRSFTKILNRLTFGFLEEFFSTQYFFTAEKA